MSCNLLLFKQDHLLLLRTEPWVSALGPAPALILPDFFAGLQDFADSVGPLATPTLGFLNAPQADTTCVALEGVDYESKTSEILTATFHGWAKKRKRGLQILRPHPKAHSLAPPSTMICLPDSFEFNP